MRKILRKMLFKYCFTEHEKLSMTNALFRRNQDLSTEKINGDNFVRYTCQKLAMEFSEY